MFALCKRHFAAGEEIPFIEFMYKPKEADIIKEHGDYGRVDHKRKLEVYEEYQIGDKFPVATKDDEVILVHPGCIYFQYEAQLDPSDTDPYGWVILYAETNLPVAAHYLSGEWS
jgi:hypothetical protein